MTRSLKNMLVMAVFVLTAGYISAGFVTEPRKVNLQNVDTKFSSCVLDEANESATCQAAQGQNFTVFHNVYKQCTTGEAGSGTKIGTLPQTWGKGCTVWQKKPEPKAGTHRRATV